jgi:hypothetical protein
MSRVDPNLPLIMDILGHLHYNMQHSVLQVCGPLAFCNLLNRVLNFFVLRLAWFERLHFFRARAQPAVLSPKRAQEAVFGCSSRDGRFRGDFANELRSLAMGEQSALPQWIQLDSSDVNQACFPFPNPWHSGIVLKHREDLRMSPVKVSEEFISFDVGWSDSHRSTL